MTQLSKRKWDRKNIFILCVSLFLIVCVSYKLINVFAKYYAARYNKGIAIASNLYFNSDRLMKTVGITDLDEILNNEEDINKINVYTNSNSWASGPLLLSFSIRNYDNNILFNDSDLDIGYRIKFVLLDEPIGATYSVENSGVDLGELKEKNSKIEVDGMIKGGSMVADMYSIRINMTDTELYKAARVLVLAYPISPDYVARPEDKNHEYRLLGIFQGQPTDAEISIENARFKIQEADGYSATTWKGKVADLSGYIYNVKTAGDVVLDNNTATKQQARIIWDNRYVTIDKYDENYQYALEHDSVEGLAEEEKYVKKDGDKTSMVIMILPYTSIDFTFYKTENFATKLNSYAEGNSDGKAWFESLVMAEIVKDDVGREKDETETEMVETTEYTTE